MFYSVLCSFLLYSIRIYFIVEYALAVTGFPLECGVSTGHTRSGWLHRFDSSDRNVNKQAGSDQPGKRKCKSLKIVVLVCIPGNSTSNTTDSNDWWNRFDNCSKRELLINHCNPYRWDAAHVNWIVYVVEPRATPGLKKSWRDNSLFNGS